MSVIISQETIAFINSKSTHKVLATTGKDGSPHVVLKESFFYEDGKLMYLELLEASLTNKNMIYSLWFDKKISINFFDKSGKSIQIKGKPVKAIVAGAVFEKYYEQIQAKDKDSDLAAVYFIEIDDVMEETYQIRRCDYEKKHPLYMHIDRIAK